jgi:hypothetical protein
VEQQQPDGFPAHFRNQSSFYCLFGHQPHRPASPARGRIAANHGDDAFSFGRLQQRYRAGALLVVKSFVQTRCFIPASNLADRLGSQGNQSGNFGSRLAVIQLLQRQRAEYSAHRLHSATQHAVQVMAVCFFKAHLQPPIRSHASG